MYGSSLRIDRVGRFFVGFASPGAVEAFEGFMIWKSDVATGFDQFDDDEEDDDEEEDDNVVLSTLCLFVGKKRK